MDLKSYRLEDIFLAAIKNEKDSANLYSDLSDRVKNVFLKEKLRFLAWEEMKHEALLTSEFGKQFPGQPIILPERSPVPLPDIIIPDETIALSEIIDSAMQAEFAAREFYLSMRDLFDEHNDIRLTLEYLSKMEFGHYQLLDIERENMARFEEYDSYWEMMNIGP